MNKMNKKGFTLIEMLVVIAIIAILVSIVIPVVGDSTEKAKEAKDAANIRSAIAEVTANGLAGGVTSKTVTLTQTGNFDKIDATDIGGFALSNFNGKTSVTVSYNAATFQIEIDGTASTGGTTGGT